MDNEKDNPEDFEEEEEYYDDEDSPELTSGSMAMDEIQDNTENLSDIEVEESKIKDEIDILEYENNKLSEIIHNNIELFNENRDKLIDYKFHLPDKSGGNIGVNENTGEYDFEKLDGDPPIHKLDVSNNILISRGFIENLKQGDDTIEGKRTKPISSWEIKDKKEFMKDFSKQILQNIRDNIPDFYKTSEKVMFLHILQYFRDDIFWFVANEELIPYKDLFKDKDFYINENIQLIYDT